MASTELRAAAQQALEALEYYRSGEDYQPTPASNAITALKAALAEPPVDDPHRDHWVAIAEAAQKIAASTECGLAEAKALCAALDRLTDAALAEPQEPMPTLDEDEAQVFARLSKTPAEAYERGYMDGHSRGVEVERERCARSDLKCCQPVQEPAQKTEMRRCPRCWEPMFPPQPTPLTVERLRDALVAARIVPPAAVEDPDGYDDGVTLHRIEALHRRLA